SGPGASASTWRTSKDFSRDWFAACRSRRAPFELTEADYGKRFKVRVAVATAPIGAHAVFANSLDASAALAAEGTLPCLIFTLRERFHVKSDRSRHVSGAQGAELF